MRLDGSDGSDDHALRKGQASREHSVLDSIHEWNTPYHRTTGVVSSVEVYQKPEPLFKQAGSLITGESRFNYRSTHPSWTYVCLLLAPLRQEKTGIMKTYTFAPLHGLTPHLGGCRSTYTMLSERLWLQRIEEFSVQLLLCFITAKSLLHHSYFMCITCTSSKREVAPFVKVYR